MKKKISLKWKVGRYLLIYAVFVVLMLCVFQFLLLEPMYKRYKQQSLKYVSDEIVEKLDDEDLSSIIYSSQSRSDTCIRVMLAQSDDSTSSYQELTQENFGCELYRMRRSDTLAMVADAMESDDGTSYTSKKLLLPGGENDTMDNLFLTRVVETASGYAVVMVSAGITPINATLQTLTTQMMYIGVILLAATLILTIFMNKFIATPLSKINEQAKGVSSGEYTVDESTNQYREAQELNETLSKAAEDVQKADKAKRDLISNVSHDLRTPLTMITGYGEMMIDLPDEKTDENIQVIIDESRRLNNLVNDLLDLSRMQENRITLNREDLDFTALIETQMKKYEVYIYQDGYQIEQELAGPVTVNCDRKRMEQVFNNFMTNAINYSGERKHIIVRELLQKDKVRVEIQDYGEGIEEKDLKNIWDRYYKVDKTHVRVQNGSGIGLSIVKEVLDLHGFEYGVISQKGEGSTFWFEMPIVK